MIRRSTWIVVAVFGVVLAAAFLIQRNQQNAEAETTPTPGLTYLFDVQGSEIIGLRIVETDGNSLAVQRDQDGQWALVAPEDETADQARIDSLVSQAESLRVLATIEEEPEAAATGLDSPSYRIAVTLANGQTQEAVIGSETPTGSGYYARVEGGQLQVANKSSVDGLLEALANPPVAATATPAVEVEATPVESPEP